VCKRYGIHAQTARQVEQTFDQILNVASRSGFIAAKAEGNSENASPSGDETAGDSQKDSAEKKKAASDDGLLHCLMAGFIDQLCIRRDQGTLECEMTEGRQGTLMRESVVQAASLFVVATIREVEGRGYGNLTLLGLATAIKREWIQEMFPHLLRVDVEHLYDRTHKRVAAVKLIRFQDLVIHHEHQKEVVPAASGKALAEAYLKGWFELPMFNHEIKQLIARVALVCAAMPDLEYPPFDEKAIAECLARAFAGLTLAKEAQGTPLKDAFLAHLAPEQAGWLDELAPTAITWHDGKKVKLTYGDDSSGGRGSVSSPEASVKMQDCFQLPFHPMICEGSVPVKLWLCGPDNKRIASTCDWPHFKANEYPKLKSALAKKYPSVMW